MNAKEYLKRYKQFGERIKILESEIEELRTKAEGASINLDGLPKGQGAKDRTAKFAIELAEYDSRLNGELSAAWKVRMEIVETLGKLSYKHQRLLHEYYIKQRTWEEVAEELGITSRYCYMLHGSALAELNQVLNSEKK